MNNVNRWLVALALLVVAGLGYGAARFTDPHTGAADEEHVEGEEHADEEEHTEGEEHVEGEEHADEEEHTEGEEHVEGEEEHEEGVVALSPEQIAAANIAIVSVQQGGGAETRLSGRVEATPDAQASVGAALSGTVERLLVSPGEAVSAGQPLASIISGDGAVLAADAAAANAEAEAASLALGREQRLFDQGVVAQQDLEAARARAASAEAQARAARARAAAAGSPSANGSASVIAPIAGVVTSLRVGPGGFVQQGEVVATITNPEQVEMVFSAPPALAASVRPGDTITAQAAGGGEYVAEVVAVAPDAGGASGATQIRARSTAGLPPVGSALTGSIVTDAVGALTVPSEAVQTLEGANVVFVATDEGFAAVPVLVGRQAGGRTEIVSGLTGAERIAGSNAFLLKAELSKGEAEHGH